MTRWIRRDPETVLGNMMLQAIQYVGRYVAIIIWNYGSKNAVKYLR